MNKNKVGLTLGLFGVATHLIWSILVMSGIGQTVNDWILRMHAIDIPVVIGPMSFGTMLTLLVAVFIGWYLIGWVFAAIWNRINK